MNIDLLIKKKNLIYLIALLLEIIAMLIDLTTIPFMVGEEVSSPALKMIRYLGYLLVVVKLLLDDYSRTQICVIMGIIIILIANSISVGGNAALCLFLFVIGMKDIDFYYVCKVVLVFYILGVCFTALGATLGIIDNWKYTLGGRVRYSLGYFYPSHATSALFYTICLFCFVYGKKLRLWHVVLFEIINIWQYRITTSRAGTLLLLFLPIMFYLVKFTKKELKTTLYGRVLSFTFPICATVSLISALVYKGTGILARINELLNNRIVLANNAIKEFGFSLFGENIEWIGNGGYGYTFNEFSGKYNYVDCSYIKILLDEGIVFYTLIIIGFTIVSVQAVRKNDKYLLLALVFVAVYSIIEPRLITIGFNPFVLTLAALIEDSNPTKYTNSIKRQGEKYETA